MTKKNKVLVLAKKDCSQLSMLNGIPHVTAAEASAFVEEAKNAEVILNWSGSPELLRSVFRMCDRLRWVHSRAAGVDNQLFPELVESDVVLTNGSGVFSASLGEFVLAAMLYFAKDFRRMLRQQAADVWEQFDVEEVAGRTVGIIGYGDIGRAIATRAKPMGMRILALKRHPPQIADPLVEGFYKPEAMREMIAKCDYIVSAAPLTQETHHMISDGEFASMKPNAVVLNVGRGSVIDERALLSALSEKRIRGAALDVFEREPLPAGHPLYGFENVLLSPHCADHTADWHIQAMALFLDQYRRFEKREPLENVVNKRMGY